jgi:putative restriction endonuclease
MVASMTSNCAHWLAKLGRLHPAISRRNLEGNARYAPHKPLLLLCLIDAAESGELKGPEVGKTPGLCLRFDSYWAIVQERWGGRPGLGQPFHYLSNQGFWSALCDDGRPSRSHHTTESIRLDPGFFACLQEKSFRRAARYLLIRTWFPEPEQKALLAALGITKAEARKQEFKIREDSPEYEAKGRDARFRVVVVTQYRFTCALTGYGLHTRRGGSIVEAAHIHQFSKSRNDNPDNGLALTRDAHWMFDEGLWTVDERHRVSVSREIFTEWGPEARWLKRHHGRPLTFLEGVQLRPAPEHFAWHRASRFAG